MTADEFLFFNRHEDAWPLYEALRARILERVPDARIEVRKTQISFFRRHMFAAVSFTPVRRAKDRPKVFLTVTFGLRYKIPSPRVDVAVEPSPNRWTHHVIIGSVDEIDDELLSWLQEAAIMA